MDLVTKGIQKMMDNKKSREILKFPLMLFTGWGNMDGESSCRTII